MNIQLLRFACTPENTQSLLQLPDWSCFTIGRPWIAHTSPGGKPFESCIPEGHYDLIPYIRKRNGDKSFAMVNEALGVYFMNKDRPFENGVRVGRFKTLLHGRANYVSDVEGCEATGEKRMIHPKRHEQMVTNSTATMAEFIRRVGWVEGHTLEIIRGHGAHDGGKQMRWPI